MIKLGIARKFIAILANLSLLLNSFVPFLLAVKPTYAQEATPTETVVPTVAPTEIPTIIETTPTPEVTVTPEITPEVIPEVTPTIEVTPTPELTPTIDPINIEVGTVTPPVEEITPTPETITPESTPSESNSTPSTENNTSAPTNETPIVETPVFEKVCLTDQQIKDTTNEDWVINNGIYETKGNVQLGVRYVYPQDNKVSVTFKCLPKDESLRTSLKIQKVKTADLNLPNTLGSVGEYAYDITTGMKNGDFNYDITLPKPANSTAEISYIEKSVYEATQTDSIPYINTIGSVEQQTDTVKATNIDHFTIFIPTFNIIGSNWQCTSDAQGVNDVPGQKDLTIMCRDQNSTDPLDISWNWDEISLSGNNTGDGCALFDTNSNGKANYAICSSWDQIQHEVVGSPKIYLCNDTRPDRCTDTISSITTSYCDISNDINDPFTSGDAYPNDTKSFCSVNLADVGTVTNAVLLDVCSYPSQQPNSDPSDCILTPTTGQTGKLEIIKNLIPTNNSGLFNLLIDEVIKVQNVGNTGTTSETLLSVGNHTFSEIGGTNTNLSDYTTTVVCKDNNGAGSIIATTGSFPWTINITRDKDIVCTLTNTLKEKCGDGSQNQASEECDAGAQNGAVCTPPYGTNGQPASCNYCSSQCKTITLTDGYCGDNIRQSDNEQCDGTDGVTTGYSCSETCTLTRNKGTITVHKVFDGDGPGTYANSCFTLNPNPSGFGEICANSNGDAIFSDVPSGTYSVDETKIETNWNQKSNDCSGLVITNNGDSKSCTVTNQHDTGKLIIQKVVDDGSDLTQWSFSLDGGTAIKANVQGIVDFGQVITNDTHTITESGPNNYHFVSFTGTNCTVQPTNSNTTAIVTKGNTTTCTFTNAVNKGTLTIIKDAIPNNFQDFSFTTTGSGLSNFSLDDDSNNTLSNTKVFSNLFPGTYSVAEGTINGWDKTSAICDDGSPVNAIVISPSENVTCTFTNTKKGSLKIIKDSQPDDTQNFIFRLKDSNNNQIGFTELDDDNVPNSRPNNYTFNNLTPATYKVYEDSVAGWTLDNISCDTQGQWSSSGGYLTIDILPGQQAVCTFTNGLDAGSLTAFKYEDKNNNQQQNSGESGLSGWDMNLYSGSNCNSGNYLKDLDTNSSGNADFGNLTVGNYSIKETMKSGWDNSTALCQNITINHNDNKILKFGNYRLGKIEGRKFYDKDGDGNKDDGENYLENWRIFIDKNNNGIYDNGETHYHTDNNGYYKFENLSLGDYTVCEQMQSGWYNSTPICKTTTITPNDTDTINFGNLRYGSIKVCKVVTDVSGQIVDGSALPDSNFSISGLDTSTSQGGPAGVLGTTSFTTPLSFNTKLFNSRINNAVCTTYSNLKIGNYYYGQESIPGDVWVTPKYNDGVNGTPQSIDNNFYEYSGQLFDSDPNNDGSRQTISDGHIVLSSDNKDRTLIILNQYKFGSINVTKFNDEDGNGFYGEEQVLGDWTINLTNQTSIATNEKGQVVFEKLVPGNYDLSENIQPGWIQTNIYCENEENKDNDNSHQISLTAGQNINCYIGNQLIPPTATIAKSNNVIGVLSPGDSVQYTIDLGFSGNDVDNFKVTDLLSNGFKYRLGSYKVYKDGNDVTSLVGEPQYHSPGVWDLTNLGVLTPQNKIKLVYTADISTDQQAGTYYDLAYARGQAVGDQSLVIALAQNSDQFVGTQVPVNTSSEDSVSAGVQKNETVGQVLGATTEMPSTGAATAWLIISTLLGAFGFGLIKSGKLATKMAKKTTLIILLTLLSFGFLISPARAIDNIIIRVEQPKTPTNIKNLQLKFVALNTFGESITAKCFKQGPSDSVFSQFGSDMVLNTVGGDSSSCDLSSVITNNGSYQFYVTAYSVSGSTTSNTVNLDYNTSTPGTPTDYRKEQINSCDFKIHFKTADDGGKTVKVELFRSTSTDFSANSQSLVNSVDVGSNQEKDIYNSVPDCSKTYYFVIRAFDSAGNGSGVVGDSVTITTTTTTTTSTTANRPAGGAIPLINANIPTEELTPTAGEEIVPSPEPQTGTILGTESTNPKSIAGQFQSFINRHKILSALVAILLLIIIGYGVNKIRSRKK